MKKMMFGLVFALLASIVCPAQNGLENITVEKYYVSNAGDAAGSVGTIPVGSVTYRVYADLLPNYTLQAAYGVAGHTLLITSSTSFFNNEDYGSTVPSGISVNNTRKNSVMIDSWFSMGGNAAGKVAVLKTEDTDGALVNNTVPPILQHNDASAGIPINTQDGMIAGTPASVTFVGIPNIGNGDLGVFDGLSQIGNSFSTANGSVAVLGGVTGPTTANRVLIGQFTTDGIFHFELNLQLGVPGGGTQSFVASNPVGAEISIPSLTGTFGAPNIAPTVSITAPANGSGFITGALVTITATAADADGTVASVEFFIDGNLLSTDNSAPYIANYTGVAGSHCITARATDNNGSQTTTSCVNITVASNPPPTVNITSPTNGTSFTTGGIVSIVATAIDNGSVASVEFFVDGTTSLGVDNIAPYTTNYTAAIGSHCFTAKAIDNLGAQATSSSVCVLVANNNAPTVSITSPSNGAVFTAPAVVTINANANDADGTVAQVEFFVNGGSVGIDNSAPYIFNWTSVIGPANLIAKATDNNGAVSSSAVISITIADPNALPYQIVTINTTCNNTGFCLPLAASDSVSNIIGYDVVLQYDKTKVVPTGSITVDNDLINPSFVDVIKSIDAANGRITISAFFNISAPANANFNGIGNVFCIGFNKSVNFTSVDTAAFSVVSLQESYFNGVVTQLADGGKFITYRDSVFTGTLEFWIDNSRIKYNALNPSQYLITNIYGTNDTCGNLSSAVQPDTLGNFQYVISNGENIAIDKDIVGTTDVQPVINGFDALLVSKVLLNDLSFIPNIYQAIAMDVNLDGFISAGDISQLNQRTVLMIPEFKQAWNYNAQGVSNGQPSKDWLFIDSITLATDPAFLISATYPLNDGVGFSKAKVPAVPFCLPIPVTLSDCPIITPETFDGILIGDVNGNFSTATPNNLFRQASDKVVLDLSNAVIANGYVDVPVLFSSVDNVNALDFSFKFNDQNLAFNSIIDLTGSLQALSNYNADDKTLRFTSSNLQNLISDKAVVAVRFAVKNLSIDPSDFNSLKGYLNGDKVAMELNGDKTLTNANNVLVNVYPNPASSMLNILVSENATIELLSVDGREVVVKTIVNANEKMQLSTQTIANGVYMLKVSNNNFVSIQKVVIKK